MVTLAWSRGYFDLLGPRVGGQLPVDRRASGARGRTVRVLEDAERFPSDPEDTILEANDVAVLLRSDHLDVIDDVQARLFGELEDVFVVSSIRKGFVGPGLGTASIARSLAVAARIAGADLVPPDAQLLLGFTSTQAAALGPRRIANLETLGYADMGDGYFAGGTHMHLSHVHENLNAWYLNFDHDERVAATFGPGTRVPIGRTTVRQGPEDVREADGVRDDYARYRTIGHASAIQTASRLDRDVVGVDATTYPRGTPVPQRADFNTLDNPFAWSATPERDGFAEEPAAGLHFVVFNPSSDDFRRVRLAMDGVLPDATRLAFAPRDRGQGFNSVLRTTHRQNFLVPPRRSRSFPLVERLR